MDLRVVLVGTTNSANIGSVARAMKNFALNDFYLVSPKVLPDDKSLALASNAKDVLANVKIVDNIEKALKDCQRVIATSTRMRKFAGFCSPLRQRMPQLCQSYQKVAVVFGRESSGLTNQELDFCDEQIFIPANPQYSSLNLAQAVQIISYEWGLNNLNADQSNTHKSKTKDFVTHTEFDEVLNHLNQVLKDINYLDEDPKLLFRRLKHLFSRINLEKAELKIVRGVLSTIQKKVDKN